MIYHLVIAAFAAIFYFLYDQFIGRRRNLPPGPLPLPFIGNLHQLDEVYPDKTIFEWSKKYGPMITIWLPSPTVFVCEFELLKELFVRQGESFMNRPRSLGFDSASYGYHGISMASGAYWKEQRRFAMNVLREFGFGRQIMEKKIMLETHELVRILQQEYVGKPVDISRAIESSVINIVMMVLYGKRYEYGHPIPQRLKDTNDKFNELFQDPSVMLINQYPWLRRLPLRTKFDDFEENRHAFCDIVQTIIDERKKTFDPTEESEDFLTAYLLEMHKRRQATGSVGTFTDRSLNVTISDLNEAGTETTVVTLRWSVLYMMHYPEVQKKLQVEIDSVLGCDGEVTMADKARMPYTAAAVHELQRCTNLLPVNVIRSVTKATTVNGYHLKAGQEIVPQISALMIDPSIFTEPEKFDPSRFINPGDGSLKKMDELMPFSLGKRVCPGESLARMELFLMFASLIQKFEFSSVPGKEIPTLVPIIGSVRRPRNYECVVKMRPGCK